MRRRRATRILRRCVIPRSPRRTHTDRCNALTAAQPPQFPPHFAPYVAVAVQHNTRSLLDVLKGIAATFADRFVVNERISVRVDPSSSTEQQAIVVREETEQDVNAEGEEGYKAWAANEAVPSGARRYVVRMWDTGVEHTVTASQVSRPKRARGAHAAPSVPPPKHVLQRWMLEHFARKRMPLGAGSNNTVELWAIDDPAKFATWGCPKWLTADVPSWRAASIVSPVSPTGDEKKRGRSSAGGSAAKRAKKVSIGAPTDQDDAVMAEAAAAVAAAA